MIKTKKYWFSESFETRIRNKLHYELVDIRYVDGIRLNREFWTDFSDQEIREAYAELEL